jgi:peptidyl-prolyl cis-trans isomerase C
MRTTLFLLGAVIAWGQQPPPADPVVITIGGEKITKSQFEQILSGLPQQQQAAAASPEGRRQLAEQLAELKAMAQAARVQKLDQDPRVQTRIALQVDQVLAGLLYQGLGNSAPDEAALKSYYDEHKQEWEQVKARHILIRMQGSRVPLRENEKDLTDEEALAKTKEVRAKLIAGGDFAELAKTESDDAGSGANGGDLGSFPKGRMVPEFEQAAFALKVGDVSEPVKTPFGYHLIQVQEHDSKAFDDVRAEVAEKIKPDMAKKGIEDVKKKTSIVFNEAYFGK